MRRLAPLFLALPLFAVTGGDVMDKMTEKEQSAYISGAVDMMITQDEARAACVQSWYYAKDGAAQKLIAQALTQYRDKQATVILKALVKKQCQ